MTLLENKQFLDALDTAFTLSDELKKPTRTIWITMKQYKEKGQSSSVPSQCLVRAKYGRKFKISTLVSQQQSRQFLQNYNDLLKKHASLFLEASSA
ncbi:hypothetical protein HMI56_000170 [Coelomomyces lativittatus]|nr:hypothetical protein HMI56_000170 [Coelomomyces lativittatus]